MFPNAFAARFRTLRQQGDLARMAPLVGVGLISVLVGAAGLFRDRLIATTYGIGTEADTFYLGIAIPLYLVGVLNSLTQTSAVPSFVRLMRHDGDGARSQLVGAVLLLNLALALAAAVMLAVWVLLGAPGLSHMTPAQYTLMTIMGAGLCGLAAFLSVFLTLLQARGRVNVITAVNAIPSVACIVILLARPDIPVAGVLWVFLLGYCLMTLLTGALALTRDGLALPRPSGAWLEPFRLVTRQYWVLAVGIVFFSANMTVDQVMSTYHGAGQLTAYTLGTRIPMFLAGLIGTAVTAVLLHEFSLLAADGRLAALHALARRYEKLFLLAIVAGIVPLMLLSQQVIALLFGGDSAIGNDLALAAQVMAISLPHLVFFAIGNVYVRALGALHNNGIITVLAIAGCLLNIVLNLVLGNLMGILGIALGTSMVYALSWLAFRRHLARLCRNA